MTAQDPSSTTPKTGPNPMFGPPKPGRPPAPGPPMPGLAPPTPGPPPTYQPGNNNWSPHVPLMKPKKSFRVHLSPLLLFFPLTAAISLDIATQSSWASISGLLTVALTAVGILLARYRAGNLTSTAATSSTLAVAASFNLVLRVAPIVVVPTWFLIAGLLLSASADLSFRTITQQVVAISEYVSDIFRLPSWIVFSVRRPNKSITPRSWLPLARGLALTALVTVPVVALLASGDRLFASLLPTADTAHLPTAHVLLMALFFPLTAGLVLTATRPSASDKRQHRPENPTSFPLELLLLFAGLAAVLGVWCAVQLLVISDGSEIIARTGGLTRADYAREGFFQLVAVAGIVVTVVTAAGRSFRRAVGSQHRWAKIGLAVLTIETVALAAVALSKLDLYITSYGLTGTRLAVAWFLVWLLGTLAISSQRALIQRPLLAAMNVTVPRLMPPVQAFACAMLILFGLSNPDHFIASTNLSRSTDVVQLDQAYLLRLSNDATPIIVANQHRFDDAATRSDLSPIVEYCAEQKTQTIEYGLLGWNYSTAKSRSEAIRLCDPL